MGVLSFFKNLFGTAKESATHLTSIAEESFEQTKSNIKPYVEKLEDYTENAIDKTKKSTKPFLEKAESLVEETIVKAKNSAEPYIEKTKIYATESFETIKENATPIIENIEAVANQTKAKINEYSDKAEEMLDNIKNNFDDKPEMISIIPTIETEIEIVKLADTDIVTDQVAKAGDNFVNDVSESNQKSTEFSENSSNSILADEEKNKALDDKTNDALQAEK
jgi:ElaB/YqjD/DUF883 family membrane-anchored ribosome-binding protein